MKGKKIAVLGGGNGALAFAAYFGLRGHTVRLWEFPEFRKNFESVYQDKLVQASGVLNGEVKVECLEDLGETLQGVKLIMAVVPAFAHRRLAGEIIPHLKKDMTLVLNPGRTGGALEVSTLFWKRGIQIPVAETQSLLFACRRRGKREIHFSGVKEFLRVGVFPAQSTDEVMTWLSELIPQFRAVPDILTTSFGNIGAMFHPASALLNIGLIQSGRSYDYYHETMTEGVTKVIEKTDQERMAIAKAVGAEVFSAQTWLRESYHLKETSLHEMLQNNPAYRNISGPTDIQVRYITEDVPAGLVPMEAFGQLYGVPTPTISALISLANSLIGEDFRDTGRTLEHLGLAGMTFSTIPLFVRRGFL